jgi:membrane associated rhomboid family serine protease
LIGKHLTGRESRSGTEQALGEGVEHGPSVKPQDPWGEPVKVREPALKLPWPAAALVMLLIGLYFLQTQFGGADQFTGDFGFIPAALLQGGWYTPVTALFVHGSWGHVLVNSFFALAFCAPVARRLGTSALGGFLFLLFFVVCGVAGNLGYALVHPNDGHAVVGASGGIAGFIAGTSRLLWRGPGLAPLNSPTVVTMGVSIITLNLVVGFFHIDAGPGSDGASVAWETHIVGYITGLLLIGFFDRAAPGVKIQRSKE